uniref:Cilia- and flagella-associated protein 43 n=1 Tax=Haplochromis burtoni TaxID=8153 RepID=A0A3Q3C803_HAPBU
MTANGNSGIFAFSEEKLSPSIYVYSFPELQLKNELKGGAQLDYTSLALSHGGPYLGSCSSLPDHIITVWNWENAEPLCSQPQAGQDVVSLAFNPMNWLQLCSLGTASLTVWNIAKSDTLHVFAQAKLHQSTRARLTPSAICWTATSKLYVGCAEGFLLLVDPESHSVSVLSNPTSTSPLNGYCINVYKHIKHQSVVHLQIKGSQINIAQTWKLERPVTTVMYSPDYKTLLFSSNTVTCLACCPVAHYAAVGTTTGKVLFIDLNQEQRPRLVHEVLLYHSAVDHLV